MSKLREALGLPTDGDVTVDQIEEAFEKKQFVEKNLLDGKLSELGEKTKELRTVQDKYGKIKRKPRSLCCG